MDLKRRTPAQTLPIQGRNIQANPKSEVQLSQLPKHATRATANKRILNEVQAKILNEEKSDTVIGMRKGTSISEHADMVFGCECDTEDCKERIAMSTQEYAKVHHKNMHFIVVPAHVSLDIEEVIASFTNYSVVKKIFPQPRT